MLVYDGFAVCAGTSVGRCNLGIRGPSRPLFLPLKLSVNVIVYCSRGLGFLDGPLRFL